jgi:hypothetical protein
MRLRYVILFVNKVFKRFKIIIILKFTDVFTKQNTYYGL